ncbi:MAG: tRNA 2-thiouridine(34) synthase MnmA [Spirochaetaceae bacterium]|nr:tRNA 2-thiouridine(34) synthase MnmA [Spirochaetaceae bacterium]
MAALKLEQKEKSKIILALSGGIDSGMTIGKLKKSGWQEIFGANHIVCNGVKASSPEVLGKAESLCKQENIPFYLIDAVKEFKQTIISDFINKYIDGFTPNPCVICNENIKFTWFYDTLVKKLLAEGKIKQDEKVFFATGHYAQIEEKEGKLFIKKGVDKTKDQSYMLYRLPREILWRCVFPLGTVHKKDLIAEAKELGYSFEAVKESQDICFIEGEYGDFIKKNCHENNLKIKKGDITDVDGNYLGKHKGYVYYTIGQRKGLSLGSGPWYVVEIDSKRNRVIVGRDFHQGQNKFTIEKCNWFIDTHPATNGWVKVSEENTIECNVMVRYNSSELPCKVEIGSNNCATVSLEEKTVITPGQSAVFYKDDLVIGGGIICAATKSSDGSRGWTPSETYFAREVVSIHRDADKQLGAGLQKLNLENPFSITEKAEIYYKESTASTMNDARELIPQNPPTGTLVLAYNQTDGKGRIEGRKWLSVKGESLTFTILIKNSDVKFVLSLFPLFAGFCIAGFLKKEFGIESFIKWPNDVLINRKKVSGILCENSSGYVLCGIGINCNQENMKEISGGKGVSIYELTGITSDINDLLVKFLNFMKNSWDSKNWTDNVSKQLYNKGEKVVFYDSLTGKDNPVTGIIEGIGEDGELIMTEESTGQRKKYYSGEISFS